MATITQKRAESRIVFEVDPALGERIRIQAIRNGLTIKELCIEAVIKYLDSLRAKPGQKGDAA